MLTQGSCSPRSFLPEQVVLALPAHLKVSNLLAHVRVQVGLCPVFLPSLPRWNCGSQSHWVRVGLIRGFRQGHELGAFVIYP